MPAGRLTHARCDRCLGLIRLGCSEPCEPRALPALRSIAAFQEQVVAGGALLSAPLASAGLDMPFSSDL